ncbi:Sulfate adenylyltransferase subunit 1 [Pseudomonas fluorescens]|uniref:Sulfate adenylyltransferase subunit 1 n=1 Tax=Pseudomonas fluorescens TaxID=294 RepID=A0A5E6R4Y2_PSEFL|nr:Sulfate adenylyltransferase subunit 1 [Pseudomonas fluorescens]
MQYLEHVELEGDALQQAPFRMPVQWVNRPNLDFRGYAGSVVAGSIRCGERIRVLPSGKESRIASSITPAGEQPQAICGQAITLTLEDEIDISRGDIIAPVAAPLEVSAMHAPAHLQPERLRIRQTAERGRCIRGNWKASTTGSR